MPAADMVLGAWDVPREYIPLESSCGPLEYARDNTSSTYAAVFGPESPGPVIVSQALVFPQRDAPRGHVEGAMQMLVSTGNAQFDGPPLVEESHYFKGKLDGDRLYRYTALWRSDNVFCELALVGPPGAFNAADLHQYAAIQARRAAANLESRRPMSSQ